MAAGRRSRSRTTIHSQRFNAAAGRLLLARIRTSWLVARVESVREGERVVGRSTPTAGESNDPLPAGRPACHRPINYEITSRPAFVPAARHGLTATDPAPTRTRRCYESVDGGAAESHPATSPSSISGAARRAHTQLGRQNRWRAAALSSLASQVQGGGTTSRFHTARTHQLGWGMRGWAIQQMDGWMAGSS